MAAPPLPRIQQGRGASTIQQSSVLPPRPPAGPNDAPHRSSGSKAVKSAPPVNVPVTPKGTAAAQAVQSPSTQQQGYNVQRWQKAHPLEGDGLLSTLYHHLWKKNKNFQSCPMVQVPDTVVYEHNFPRGWYTYDTKSKEFVKKSGKDLDTQTIYEQFRRTPRVPHSTEDVDICAQYIYSNVDEDNPANTTTSVEFLTPDDLFYFLNERKQRPDGILQKFLLPKAKNNAQIQAVWSPRVCLVQRRENVHPLTDRYIPIFERCVTFDGPTHFTTEGFCAPKTKDQVKRICESMVDHFNSTEHKTITRLVCYFKVDRHDQIWLLWASSLRVIGSKQSVACRIPLNLAPTFTTPAMNDTNRAKTEEWDAALLRSDMKQFSLSSDIIFAKSICSNGTPMGSQPRTSTGQAGSPRGKNFYLTDIQRREESDKKRAAAAAAELENQPATASTADADVAHPPVENHWWSVHPIVQDKHTQIITEMAAVEQTLEDMLYSVYSHFLKGSKHPTPLRLQPPEELHQLLSGHDILQLLTSMKFEMDLQSADDFAEMQSGSPASGSPVFVMRSLNKPRARLIEEGKAIVAKIKDVRVQRLRDDVDYITAQAIDEPDYSSLQGSDYRHAVDDDTSTFQPAISSPRKDEDETDTLSGNTDPSHRSERRVDAPWD